MPRVNYVTYVTDQYGVGYTGATVTILPRYYATPINAYQQSTGTAKVATPIQTVNGKAQFWLDDSVGYNITTTGTGFQDYTTFFDAISAESFNTLRAQVAGIVAGSFAGYATPMVGITMDFAKRAGYATPIGITQGMLPSSLYATPLLGVVVDKAGRADYATPQGIPYPAISYINQNQTQSGLNTFSTPIRITSAGAFPSLNVTGLITATPGVRFADGTVQTTSAGSIYSTPINVQANTAYTITHSLGTRDVFIQCYDTINFEAFEPYIQRPTTNTVAIKFGSATPVTTYQVIISK